MTTINTAMSSRWSLRGKNYVVTGGSKGIGKAVVKSLLNHEAAGILFCSLSPCDLEEYKTSLGLGDPNADDETSTPPVVRHVVCNVATKEGRETLVEAAREAFGEGRTVHGLVNNVGINVRRPILEQTEDEYHSMLRTNVDAAYFLSRMFSGLFATEGATIVNVSSAAGVQSSGTGAAYGMTKAAVNQFTRILACEWAGRKIRVNAVTPWMTVSYKRKAAFFFRFVVLYCCVAPNQERKLGNDKKDLGPESASHRIDLE